MAHFAQQRATVADVRTTRDGKHVRVMRFFFALLALILAPLAPSATELRGVGVAKLSDGSAAIVMDATSIFPIRASALAEPKRLMLDFDGVVLATGQQEINGAGLVRNILVGAHEKGTASRLVIDLAKPALAEAVDVIPGPAGVRVIVRLAEQPPAAFAEAAKATQQQVLALNDSEFGAIDPITTGSTKKPVIVLDPGHGGVDPGAVTTDGRTEKELVLSYALALRDALAATGQFEVVMTRDTDISLSLSDRIGVARSRDAALLVSLHADSLTDENSVRGATVYTLADRASDARSARLADRENAVDATYGISSAAEDQNVSDILFDLTRRETRSFSNRFAKKLVGELGKSITINKTPRRFARFRVLTAPDIPSVLLELGFLSSPEDAAQIADPAWRASAAKAAANAIEDFLMEPDEAMPMPEDASASGEEPVGTAGLNATPSE
jgi:N-acetylmuramoyl-L-alanine amidase